MSVNIASACHFCSRILFFLLFFQGVQAQRDFTGIDGVVSLHQKTLGKDLVILVGKDGKAVYQKQSPEFNAKMPVPIEHASTWLTAAVVMSLVDAGKISLDDKVSKYIPLFNKYFKGYITIRQCLAHTTGIEAEAAGVLRLAQKSRFENLEEEVNHYVMKREIVTNAGEAFHYSQVGPNIAARVVEIVTKKTFDRIAQEKILRPVGMRTTSFYSESGGINPALGATASAQDYLNFMMMLLNKGMLNGKRVLSEASVAELMKPQFTDRPVRSTLDICKGMTHGLGAWVLEADPAGNPTSIGCPSLSGIWPWIDLKRGYAAVILPAKAPSGTMRTDIYGLIRDEIDVKMQ